MRAVLSLAVTNVVVWGAFVAMSPGSHFAWPGSYKFWWFDDVPWAVIIFSAVSASSLMTSRSNAIGKLKSPLIAVLATMLFAVLPYAALSGGGV